MNAFGLSLNQQQLVRPAEVVRSLFKDGVVVDLTPALQQESKGTFLHFDPHLNPHGHRVVALELAEQLASAIAGLASANTNLITGGAPITGGEQMAAATAGMGNTELANIQNNMANLLEVTKKVEQHLNTSVTIGAMTEKNTKETKNTLAGMGAIV